MSLITKNAIQKKLASIFRTHPSALFAYLYGSYAKGEEGPLSDIDIAVFFDKQLARAKRDKAKDAAEYDIIDAFPKQKIDLIDLNDFDSLTPLLEREIVYDGILVYSKDEAARAHFESVAIGEWLDWEPHHRTYHDAMERELLEAYGE